MAWLSRNPIRRSGNSSPVTWPPVVLIRISQPYQLRNDRFVPATPTGWSDRRSSSLLCTTWSPFPGSSYGFGSKPANSDRVSGTLANPRLRAWTSGRCGSEVEYSILCGRRRPHADCLRWGTQGARFRERFSIPGRGSKREWGWTSSV